MRGKSKKTVQTEQAILLIVDERSPITVRGVCYGLFTQDLIPDMSTNSTQRISRIMTDMRERDALDWRLIVDDSRAVDRISQWKDPNAIIRTAVKTYRRDYWQEQPNLVEIWSEKGTVGGLLAPVLEEYGVTFRVMKGFGSFTSVRQAAEDSLYVDRDKHGIVYYLGDYDPSGLYMSDVDLPKRLARYGSEWHFSRIALTKSDIKKLPHFDVKTKKKDPRIKWYLQNYGARAWELDAMNPNDLRQRVKEQIATSLDLLKWEHAKEVEAAEIESMKKFHESWQSSPGVS